MAQLEPPLSRPAKSHCNFGCSGLEDVLTGGFPRGHFYLLEGEPGTGKTTLALQFVAAGLRNGHLQLARQHDELKFNE